jgi:flagellar biogenesis protein FliO
MKSLSLATLSLSFLLAASAAHAQNATTPTAPSAPKPPVVATAPVVAQATPAPVAATPAAVATPAPAPSPAPVASPVAAATPAPAATPAAKKPVDPEAQPLAGYVTPTSTVNTNPKAMIQDVGIKLGGVIGLMVFSALGWRKLRRRGIGLPKMGSADRDRDRNEARLQVMEKLHLSPQQVLYVVRYAERVLLVGSSPQNLSLVTDLTKGSVASAVTATNTLPAPLTEAIRELETRSERTTGKSSPEPAIRTPRPVATEDRFAGILDRLRAQEEPTVSSEYRIQQARPNRTIAELDEDEEERVLAGASRGSSLFRAAGETTATGDGRWSR